MGIAFEAIDPGLPDDFGDRLRVAVRARGGWVEVERGPGAALSLCRADHSPEREWPADVDVFFDHGRLHVVFHAATRSDREQFVEVVRARLLAVGSKEVLAEV